MSLSILLVAIFASIASSSVGVFLVLRKMSMLTDAISHTVLLGIVLAFLVVSDLNSPWLIIGASVMGVFTVYLVELLVKTKLTQEDAATGVVFSFLFSLAVIIVNTKFKNTHLDIDTVLLGKIEFSIFERLIINGIDFGAKSVYIMAGISIINLVFITIFYKELKIVSFDTPLAFVLGISPLFIHYLLMGIISLTAVSAFNAVGSILVIALMIGPAMTALLFTKDLFKTIITSILIGIFNATVGYLIATYYDFSISGMIASITLATFLLALFFHPTKGIVLVLIKRKKQKEMFAFMTLIFHLNNHQKQNHEKIRLSVDTLNLEFRWSRRYFMSKIKYGIKKSYIDCDNGKLLLTNKGRDYLEKAQLKYLYDIN